MKTLLVTLLSLLLSCSALDTHKYLVLNDMHYMPNYTESCSWGFCRNMGMYGTDAPWDLISHVVDNAAENHPDAEAVFILGDFI
jgi:hypothetical protein